MHFIFNIKNVLIGAGSVQLFPQRLNYVKAIEGLSKHCDKRAKSENISIAKALTLTMQERYLGQLLMFCLFMVMFSVSAILALHDEDLFSVIVIFSMYVFYFSCLLLNEKNRY